MLTPNPALSLAQLVFVSRQPGIVITVINMHGDADAYTRHAVTFPLTAAGRADADQLLSLLEQLPTAMGPQCNSHREYLYECLEDDLGFPLAFLEKNLAEIVVHDCTYQDYFAQPLAYMVEVYSATGSVGRAQFPDYDGTLCGLRCFDGRRAKFYEEAAWPT